MAWSSLSNRLSTLPLILAGPILRRVEEDNVSVWLALKEERTLTLTVYDDRNQVVMTSPPRSTVALGTHLHIALITAKLPILSFPLSSDETYHYNVTGTDVDLTCSAAVVYLEQGFTYPTFALPPSKIDNLRIVHASCRKMHAQGYDAFVAVDAMIKEEAKFPNKFAKTRPHQLFLTGDQIYADDVDGIQLFLIRDICNTLLGWKETIKDNTGNILTSPDSTNSLCGARASFINNNSGFKFRFPHTPFNEEEVPANHLMFLGEYYCMYLLMWSPILWPITKEDYPTREQVYTKFAEFTPKVKEITENNKKIKVDEFEESIEAAIAFQKGLSAVQRSLANVPTYMICDDHEITDDWFITTQWTKDVLSSPVGTRILQNGLLAYALFQAWGNTPYLFEGNQVGKVLLDIVPQWNSYDTNDTITPSGTFSTGTTTYWQSIYQLLGLPSLSETLKANPIRLIPANPRFYLTYNYHIAWNNHEVFVLDTRNERTFPGGEIDSPILISNQGLTRQIQEFSDTVKITFLVIATPISAIPSIESKLELLSMENIYFADGEVYTGQQSAIESLYATIGRRAATQQQRKNSGDPSRIIVLSGDVHYAFTNRVEYWATRTYYDTEQTLPLVTPAHFVLAQLCASALKNEKGVIKDDASKPVIGRTGTNKAHLEGYTDDELTHPRVIIGWVPPTATKTVGIIPVFDSNLEIDIDIDADDRIKQPYSLAQFYRSPLPSLKLSVQPDWTYRIDYLVAQGGTPRPGDRQPERAADPAQALPASALQCYLDSASNAQQYVKHDGEGREAVGKNNLGEIRFTWGLTEDAKIVKHQLWWRLKNTSANMPEQEPFPLSEYEIVLGTHSAAYPKPVY
jgi:hypothetical protein